MPSLWTADSRTFVGANGTRVAHVYPDAVNYRDSSGAWHPVDNTLVGGVAGFVNAANRFRVQLPSMLGMAPIEVTDGAQWVSFSLDGASGLPGVAAGSTATYINALPGVNLRYTVTGAGLEESATLLKRSSPRSLRFTVSTSSGLTPTQEPGGSIAFDNASGQAQFSFLPPRLSDRGGADGIAKYQLRRTSSGYEVTLDANTAWLASPHRAWPVTIDPSLQDDSGLYPSKNPMHPTVDGYIASGTSASQNWFNLAYEKVGYNSDGKRRALLQFNPQGVLPKGAQILNAKLNMYLFAESTTTQAAVGVYSMTRAWTSGATWNTYDGTHGWGTGGGDFTTEPLQGTNPWATTTVGGTINKYYSWDITQLVAGSGETRTFRATD